jgi:phospholipid N-methyltransferase
MAANMQVAEQVPAVRLETFPVIRTKLRADCDRLIERVREALLEARDETDVRWIRDHAIQSLGHIFSGFPMLNQDMALIKLEVLEDLHQECLLGHMQAMVRSRKWRKAMIQRYFPI